MIYFVKNSGKTLIFMVALVMILVGVEMVNAEPSANIYVNTFDDELDFPTGDGDCSLREAIKAANENMVVDACTAGSSDMTDNIFLETGVYLMEILGQGDDIGETGDFDIRGSVNVQGNGVDSTIIHGGNIDRVFHVVVYGIQVAFSNVTIRNGQVDTGAEGGGGILVNFGTTLNVSHCRITNNNTPNSNGGGIDNFLGTVTITDTTIDNNIAHEGGGIYSDGILYVYQSLINANDATSSGGGVKNSVPGGIAILENVTISGNNSIDGSGIFSSSTINLTNITVARNIGLGAGFANTGTANIQNSIFALHFGTTNCSGLGQFNSAGNNLEDGDSCNFVGSQDQINTDPLLIGDGPKDYGGPTHTYALHPTSPAIDAGSNDGCPIIDQRGYMRPLDGNADGIPVCDIGAYEAPWLLYFPIILR